jgi:hypothetical protein
MYCFIVLKYIMVCIPQQDCICQRTRDQEEEELLHDGETEEDKGASKRKRARDQLTRTPQ